jgi:tetratricopeptide (TPR) repeat protein
MRIRGRKQKKKLAATIKQGQELLASQRRQEALDFLDEAVQQFPDDPEIRLLHASILLAFRPKDVAAEATKAVELGPDDAVILVRAAYLLLGRGEAEVARSHVGRAKELVTPEFLFYPELLSLEGRLAALDGDDDLAEERMRLAFEREPSGEMLAFELAKFLADRERHGEALEVIGHGLNHAKGGAELERLRSELVDDGGSDS